MTLYRLFVLLCLYCCTFTSSAQAATVDAYDAEARRANGLLAKAVAEYKARGDSALAEFSRQGAYVDGELYIYVVDTAGIMLASGGPSASLVGKPVVSVLDDDLKAVFEKAISQPADGTVRSAEYRWWNWQHGKVERKRVFYERVADRVISVGYYMPRASAEQARQLLHRVTEQLASHPGATLVRINAHDNQLIQDDLYAFVVDLKTQRFAAHGFLPRLVGTDFKSLRATDGEPIGEAILALMHSNDSGELTYLWRNPMTGQNEFKQTFLQRINGYIVAVGCYTAAGLKTGSRE